MQSIIALLALGAALPAVLAKTDTNGCLTSSSLKIDNFNAPYYSLLYYWPETGEICRPIDCGGGRAPPANKPGCPSYAGSEPFVETKSYIDGWGPEGQVSTEAAPSPTVAAPTPTPEEQEVPAEETDGAATSAWTQTNVLVTPTPTGYSTLITSAAVLPSATEGHSTPVESPPASTFTGAAAQVGRNVVGLFVGAAAAAALL